MSEPTKPVTITGGCVCGSIRYSITFPEETTFPLETNGTCQCTLCRKFTGTLLSQNISLPTQLIHPPLDSNETYKTYSATPKGSRGFCSTCGSSLSFQYKARPQRIEIQIGSIDEDILLGEKDGEEFHGQYGSSTTRKEGGLGVLLCSTQRSGHIFFENAILGVTTEMPGTKWYRERVDGEGFEREGEVGSPTVEKRGSFA